MHNNFHHEEIKVLCFFFPVHIMDGAFLFPRTGALLVFTCSTSNGRL